MSFRQKLILMLEFTRIHKQFQQFFRVLPALTEDLQYQAYRVRHQVYCRELGWESIHPEGIETDKFDRQSHHCLIQNVHNDEFLGCIRMVLPDADNPVEPLPFQLTCKDTLNDGEPNPELQQRIALAEVSRLAVIGKYRRRAHEQFVPVAIDKSDYGTLQHPRFPYIPIGLYLGLLEMARINQIEILYILTEPTLARHFCKLGGKLEPVGGAIEHRGKRVPYKMDVNQVIDHINLFLRPLFKIISSEIQQGYQTLNTNYQAKHSA